MKHSFKNAVKKIINGIVVACLMLNTISPTVAAFANSIPAGLAEDEGQGREQQPIESPTPSEPPISGELATQAETSTPMPTEMATETETALPSETATETATQNLSPTATMTATATTTATVTPTATQIGEPPSLTFELSLSPEQAAPGDIVTYTLKIVNQGKTAVSGLSFSDVLPKGSTARRKGTKISNMTLKNAC